jgi:hypothetical protein
MGSKGIIDACALKGKPGLFYSIFVADTQGSYYTDNDMLEFLSSHPV